MIFDGMKFRRTHRIVPLPKEYWLGTIKNYITFGVVCAPDTKGAIQTEWTCSENGNPVYAVAIPCKGHSLTNMMYGDKYLYLLYDAQVYIYKYKK